MERQRYGELRQTATDRREGETMMRTILTALAATALMTTGPVPTGAGAATVTPASKHAAKDTQRAVAKALADSARADQQGDDARRKAAEVLAFSGVGPGDEVLDFLPGSGYWTRIFSGIVGKTGHVYAVWPAAGAKYAEKAIPALEAKHMANTSLTVMSGPAIRASEPVDLFWTVQNYHDVNNEPGGEAVLDGFNRQAFAALKPGGTYIVIDHADAAGSGMTGTSTRHRIDPAAVKAQVVKAGFVFEAESDALRNPADDHSAAVFDPAIRGKTDQFVFRFRKPR
ncbi:class I SAM-dependent methyltransferase [Sphingomonas sp. PAMC 26617]|uniref:class I SAM-dependent methyltransferase n=1 Tax=Sphingomonas sp. PAMC 26617 TaxID=1112216 RepID=UPI000289D148|nr:class I SAM-dependent methyltransferase [Sphingomonas sp. PAMC 26617]